MNVVTSDYYVLVLMLGLALLVVLLPLVYLRPAIRSVLQSVCEGDSVGVNYWLRSIDVLTISGTLGLVLLFGNVEIANAVSALRVTLICALAGVFFTVSIVAVGIWRYAVMPALYAENIAATLPAAEVTGEAKGG